MAEDIKSLLDKITEATPQAKAAIQELIKEYNAFGDAIKQVSSDTKILYTQLAENADVEDWAKRLELQIANAEAMGEIANESERLKFIQDKEMEFLIQKKNALIANRRVLQNELADLKKQRDALGSAQEHEEARKSLNDQIAKKTEEITENMKEASPEVIKAAAAMERAHKASKGLASETESLVGDLTGIGSQWKDTFMGAIVESAAAAEGFSGKIAAIGKGMGDGFAKALTPMNMFMSTMQKIVEMTVAMVIKFETVTIGFRQQQGVGEEWDDSVDRLYRTNIKYGLSMEDNAQAMTDVRSSMASLSAQGQESVESMAAFIAPLKNLGINGQTAGKAMETMMKAMKKSKPEAEAMTHRMITLAQALGKPAEKMIQEFNEAMPSLAAYGAEAEKVFRGMQVEAAATGVEMGKLISIAEGFDTFESAAQQVGTLNAVLGGAYFNSMEMMNASHEDRIRLLRENFALTGKSFDQLGYYEQKAVAAAMGINDVNEAQKLLGTTQEEYLEQKKAEEEAAAQEVKDREKLLDLQLKNATAMDKFTVAMEQFGSAFKPLMPAFRSLGNAIIQIMEVLGPPLRLIGEFIAKVVNGISVITNLLGPWGTAVAVLTGYLWYQVTGLWALFAGQTAVAASQKKWKIGLMVILPLLALLVDYITKPRSPPLYVALFIVAAGMIAISRASDTMGPKLLLAGKAVALLGVGILAGTYGLSLLADSIAKMSGGQIVGFIGVIGALAAAFYFTAPALMALGAAAVFAAPGLLALGAAFLMASVGIAIVVLAIATLVDSFSNLITSLMPAVPQMIQMAISIAGLALAMGAAALVALPFAVGLVAVALGFGALALALAFIKTDDLVALGNIFQGLGMATSQGAIEIGKLPAAIEELVESLEDVDLDRLDKIANSIERMATAASTLAAVGPIGVRINTPATPAATAGAVATSAADAERARIITRSVVATEINSQSTKEIVQVIKEHFTQAGAGAAATPALPEGLLITNDFVVDLGREFDYKLKRNVEKIVEDKIRTNSSTG